MNRLQLTTTGVWLAFFVAACSSSESSGNGNTVGGSSSSSTSTGGSQNSTTSSKATGGSNSSDTTGTKSTGGASATGGKSATGGGSATGGKSATGGGSATGGKSATGGGSATGGKSATGGGSAVGGQSTTGGQSTAGGATGAGGTSGSTAGSSSSGQTGGTTTAGGSSTAGGSAATGGSSSTAPADPLCFTSTNNSWKSATLATATGSADVTVNDSATSGQTWEGFGGSFNELGWSFLTTEEMQQQAIKLLFDSADGANFAWGRIPMGASDYATSRYTLDDPATNVDPTPNGETARPAADTSLANFKIDRDKQKLIPYIKAALGAKSDIRFWGSPWTPPIWMKTGYKTSNGGDSSKTATKPSYFDGGSFNGTTANYNAYAEYYKKWVQAYKDEGINIEYVSPQNEPGYDQNYPSCLWDKTTYVSWIKVLGPAMSAINVKVMLGTLSNAESGKDIDLANAVLADSTAKSAVSVVGVQWGVLDKVNDGTTFQGLPIWATEHMCGNYPWNPSWAPAYNSSQAPNDQAYGVETWGYIRNAITKGKVTAYNAWNMVLDKSGLGIDTSRDWKQDALLVADGGKVNTTQAYYVFRHFSQYVVPKAKVLTTTGGDAVAFKNPDGSIVAVMYNSGAAKTYTVKVGSKSLQFSMPAAGWATVKIPG